MTKAQRLSLVRAISYAYTLDCNNLHHSETEQHLFSEPCPAEKRLKHDLANALEILIELERKANKKKT